MTKKINISIPKPCHENWEAMTHVEKGKFCSSCQKKVFDFTKASDKEIIDIINNENATCGRFTTSQLNRNLYTNQQKSSYWLLASATILGFLGLGNHSSYAQVKNDIVQTISNSDKTTLDTTSTKKNTIKGIVSDEMGVLAGASVVIKGKYHNSKYSDLEGKFEIDDVQLGDILEVSFAGKEKVEHKITNRENLIILLNTNITLIGEICTTKKRTFFGRQIQKVKNWFR